MYNKVFNGNKMIKIRRSKRLSQQEIADYLEVNQSTIFKWESGLSLPNANQLQLISQILDVDIDVLFEKCETRLTSVRKRNR